MQFLINHCKEPISLLYHKGRRSLVLVIKVPFATMKSDSFWFSGETQVPQYGNYSLPLVVCLRTSFAFILCENDWN